MSAHVLIFSFTRRVVLSLSRRFFFFFPPSLALSRASYFLPRFPVIHICVYVHTHAASLGGMRPIDEDRDTEKAKNNCEEDAP